MPRRSRESSGTGIYHVMPYFTKLIGFKNDEAFGKAMANAAMKLKS